MLKIERNLNRPHTILEPEWLTPYNGGERGKPLLPVEQQLERLIRFGRVVAI